MESLSSLHLLTEAVRDAGADIAPTYQEYIQLAFAIATDCGEVGRQDFLTLCSLSPKYDRRAADKLFSNALRNGRNNVHLGTAFHLAELCNVRPRPAEKPRQDAPAGTLGTPGAPYPAASHTHAHGYYNKAEMPAEEFPEAPAASLPAEAADAGTAYSGTANAGTTYPEAADEETCRGSEPLTPLPCFDNRTLWPAPPNPKAIPIIFITVAFSCRKKTEMRNTHIGCIELNMALETGVVLLMPSR